MRKASGLVAVVAALGVAALAIAVSAGAESGPSCANITGANWNYTAGSLNFGLILDDAASAEVSTPCKSVTYTLIVSGTNEPPFVVTQKGSNLFTGITIADSDNNICVSATAGSKGKIHDAAPDAGCLEVTLGTSGGSSGFN